MTPIDPQVRLAIIEAVREAIQEQKSPWDRWLPLVTTLIAAAVAFGVAWMGYRWKARGDHATRLIDAHAEMVGSILEMVNAVTTFQGALYDSRRTGGTGQDVSEEQARMYESTGKYRAHRARVAMLEHHPKIRELETKISEAGLSMIYVFPNSEDGLTKSRAHAKELTERVTELIDLVRKTYAPK